jgi:hypothetical protein
MSAKESRRAMQKRSPEVGRPEDEFSLIALGKGEAHGYR